MALVVNTNVASIQAQYNVNKTNQEMSQAMDRLSSGMRINSAADDAAGLAISSRMEAQVRGLSQSIRNANDAISLTQTAEGAMDEMDAILQRMNELAIQAANGAMNPSDRQAIQDEVDVLISEIDRIADQTRFNNIKVLDGSFADQFMVGQAAGEKVALEIGDMRSTAFGVGAFADNGMTISTSRGNVEGNESIAQIDKLTLSGTPTSGDVYEIDVDGSKLTYTVTGSEGGLGGVRDAIAQRINNDASIKRIVSASAGTGSGEILLTAKAAGEGFSASAVGKDVASLNSVSASVATVQQNVAAVTAQAQVDRVTIAGAVEVGDTYTLTADGQTVSYTVGTSDGSIADIVTGIRGEISNNAYMSAKFTVASATTGATVDGFTITANNAGESFQAAFSSTNRVAAASTVTQTTSTANASASEESQVVDFSAVGPIEQDDQFSVTIGTQSFSYTANAGDTVQTVRNALSTAIGTSVTNLAVSNVGSNQIKLQASSGAQFTVTALSTNNAGSTNDNTITVNAATQAAQTATVGLSEFVVSNANLKLGEQLEFDIVINGTTITSASKYAVVANDLVDQTAFRNRLVTFLNGANGFQGAATSPVFSAGQNASSIDITAGGAGSSAHVSAGAVRSDNLGTSKATFLTNTSTLDDGDTLTFAIADGNGAITSAAYTIQTADVGATAGNTLVSNLATFLNSDAAFTGKFSFNANALDLEITALRGGAANDVVVGTGATLTIANADGDATTGTLANPTLAAVSAAGSTQAATSGSSFNVRTTALDSLSQVQSVTITGTAEKGDKYVFNHGATKFEYTVLGTEGPTLAHLRNAIVTAMNAGGSSLTGVATAANGAGAGDIILTSTGNSAVTITGTATDRGSSANANAGITVTSKVVADAQVEKFALAGNVEEGDVYTVTVGGTSFAYTATAADVAGGMRALTDSIIAGVNGSGLSGAVLAERSSVASEFTLKSQTPGTAIVASLAITNRSAAVQTTNISTTTDNRVAVSAVAQKDAVAIASPGASGFTAGLTFSLTSTVDGGGTPRTFTYTTANGDSAATVISSLITGFNSIAGAEMTATADPNDPLKIFVTANVAGTDITTVLGDGTDSATALSADVSSVQANQGGVVAVAQQEIVELAGTVEGQDTYSLTINGETISFTTTGMEKSLDAVASTLADLVNANGNIASKVLAESAGNGQIRLTSKIAGEAFSVQGSAENGQGGSLNAVSVLDQDQAENALKVISAAIERVNYQRSALGAMENRLDHTISNLGNIVTNTEASQSRIADADFAAESAKLAKNQILLQAGTAMLAQANASQQTVLSLLG